MTFIDYRWLFYFYIIFWIDTRFYIFADSYIVALILFSLGQQIDKLFLVGYIFMTTPKSQIGLKLFWKMFFIYTIIYTSFYSYVQFNTDHKMRLLEYGNDLKSSAATMISKELGTTQDLFICFYVCLIILILRMRFNTIGVKYGE